MEYGSSIISLMFFIAFCIYLFWAIYGIKINPKGRLNKIFFSLNISLCIWSFGYGMTIGAGDIESALFWMRFSSIGKMPLFSIILHFTLLLTNKDLNFKKTRLFILIHIPALINIYIFTISNTMSYTQYHMIKMNYGWINRPVNNLWSFLYYFYYTFYIVFSLIIMKKWKKEFNRKLINKQVNFFL